jgi:HAD superfamily hydrolase (TIGR01549 family)
MIKAILLDMDNTLLHNPDVAFAKAFIEAANAYFQRNWGYDGFRSSYRRAIQQMNEIGRLATDQTNYDFILKAFAEDTGLPEHEIDAHMRRFFDTDYQQLEACVQPVTGAAELIAYLKSLDYAVVIATNPIYPAEAIRQRLRWAGLVDAFDHYSFVTHAENTHFAKPNPAYYAEILGRIGIEPDETVFIGDSLKNDMIPAQTIGIQTFHIQDKPSEWSVYGTLRAFYDQIADHNWLDTLKSLDFTPAMIEPQLNGSISALYGLLENVQTRFWRQQAVPGEWSLLQIVCHLAESEETIQRPRIERILAEDDPFLAQPKKPLDPEFYYCDADGWAYATSFAESRRKTIQLLRQLTEEQWQRPARHSIFGPTTLLEMAHFTAQHDRLHLNQLCQTLGHCR